MAVPTSWSCVPGAVPVSARRGSLQLWQFLIALLDDPANCGAITWTGRGMEFKLIEPEEVSGGKRAATGQYSFTTAPVICTTGHTLIKD